MAQVNRSVSLAIVLHAGLLTAALTLGGCTSKNDHPSTPSAGQPPITSAPASPSPDSTSGSASVSPSAPSPATLTDRLLVTAAVPGLNAKWHWADGETGAAGSTPFGLCARADLVSIGATDVVERTYFPPVDTDDNAAQQIAEFPDATTTATALKVLKSWQQRCAANAATGTRIKVGRLVAVDGGSWYLVTRTDTNPDDGLFQQVGLVTSGNRIAVLTMDSVAQDFDYPSGSEPMVAMVRAAAAGLAS